MDTDGSLRERKKARTRRHIAETAAHLFAEHGYENTSIAAVARRAEVSEQTVYNYFPTKQELVLDRDEEIRTQLTDLIRTRPAGTTPANAIRAEMLAIAESVRSESPDQVRGSIGHLAAGSPTIHRLALASTARLAEAIAEALVDTTPAIGRAVAGLRGAALAWVSQTVIDESGRLSRDGHTPEEIADALGPFLEAILDDLDAWFRHADAGK